MIRQVQGKAADRAGNGLRQRNRKGKTKQERKNQRNSGASHAEDLLTEVFILINEAQGVFPATFQENHTINRLKTKAILMRKRQKHKKYKV
jgi:hypothetical protein